jgi:LysR family nod box-dependent transcriptional activator
MRFRGLDLNLLVVLDTLLTARNVSRASEKLNLSQSATSSALSRLREQFDDEILVPLGRELVPTLRALELAPVIRAILMQIETNVLSNPEFDPVTSTRRFRLMASDFVCLVAARHALIAISRVAPGMQFDIVAPSDEPAAAIERGEVDILIMPDFVISNSHPSEILFQDGFACIIDETNESVGDNLTLDQYLALPHAIVRFSGKRQPAFEDFFIGRYGHTRSIEVITSSHATLPFMVAGTQRIATLHERHARLAAGYLPLRVLPVPITIPPIRELIQWHTINNRDAGLAWVRRMLIANQGPAASS